MPKVGTLYYDSESWNFEINLPNKFKGLVSLGKLGGDVCQLKPHFKIIGHLTIENNQAHVYKFDGKKMGYVSGDDSSVWTKIENADDKLIGFIVPTSYTGYSGDIYYYSDDDRALLLNFRPPHNEDLREKKKTLLYVGGAALILIFTRFYK